MLTTKGKGPKGASRSSNMLYYLCVRPMAKTGMILEHCIDYREIFIAFWPCVPALSPTTSEWQREKTKKTHIFQAGQGAEAVER